MKAVNQVNLILESDKLKEIMVELGNMHMESSSVKEETKKAKVESAFLKKSLQL